jgi:hypothetical protein
VRWQSISLGANAAAIMRIPRPSQRNVVAPEHLPDQKAMRIEMLRAFVEAVFR